MKKIFYILLASFFVLSCRREITVSVPDAKWELFTSPLARPLGAFTFQKMEGIYRLEEGEDAFGPLLPAKFSYTVSGIDTTYHLSFFSNQDAAYFILEGRRLDSSILLDGYWRRMVNSETGKARFTITKENGGRSLLIPGAFVAADSILINGVYGNGNEVPSTPIRLRYTRPIYKATAFEILAHRGGGRTADQLPASENSVEIIKLASRFGATGVEIDVRLTKDGVPVLFHDATLNERVIRKNGLVGPIENYTYEQLYNLVRLTGGERIPTLQDALQTILTQTPLEYVWLDTKFTGSLQRLREIQADYLQRAAAANRRLEIVIGIPDKEVLSNFKKLPGYQNIPSLVEYSSAEATDIRARVWAPQWTLGLQTEEVMGQQVQGRRVFTWTMDIGANIERYMREGAFNGILTNYPSIVAYHYYVRQ